MEDTAQDPGTPVTPASSQGRNNRLRATHLEARLCNRPEGPHPINVGVSGARACQALTVHSQGSRQHFTALVTHSITGNGHRGKRGDPRCAQCPGQFWPLAAKDTRSLRLKAVPRKANVRAPSPPPKPVQFTLTDSGKVGDFARLQSSPACCVICPAGQKTAVRFPVGHSSLPKWNRVPDPSPAVSGQLPCGENG